MKIKNKQIITIVLMFLLVIIFTIKIGFLITKNSDVSYGRGCFEVFPIQEIENNNCIRPIGCSAENVSECVIEVCD